jgi:lipopolysaccharide biosynthesis glycosyltransferase
MLQLTNPEGYFGSGVVVNDLDALRLREIQFKALCIAKEQHALPGLMGHDALNIALAVDWLPLIRNGIPPRAKQVLDSQMESSTSWVK